MFKDVHMFKDATGRSRALAGVLLVGAGLASSAGAASAEEMTVYGQSTAHGARAAFEAQMQAYSRALDRELKEAISVELRETVAPRLLLAANEDQTRG